MASGSSVSQEQGQWVLAFPTESDFARAVRELEGAGVAFRRPNAVNGYPFYLFVSADEKSRACSILLKAKALLSGQYEVRKTPTPQERLRSAPAGPDDLVRGAAVTYVAECFADPTKIRLIAQFSDNVKNVLPYLNAVLPNATYTPGGPFLTFSKGMRMITVYPERVAIAKADDMDDGWLTVNWVCGLLNYTWRRRTEITPCFERRIRATALEIFGWLPRTNCRKCGELTCLAFAAKLLAGEQALARCSPLNDPVNAQKKQVLAEMLGI